MGLFLKDFRAIVDSVTNILLPMTPNSAVAIVLALTLIYIASGLLFRPLPAPLCFRIPSNPGKNEPAAAESLPSFGVAISVAISPHPSYYRIPALSNALRMAAIVSGSAA